LTWAEARYESVRGPIAVRWERDRGRFRLHVTVPPNARASIQIPVDESAEITEGGQAVRERSEIVSLGEIDGRPAFEVGAGQYEFEAR